MKTHPALAVANWFLARAEAENQSLDPMKIQKLIYFSHGWSLALTGIPLIEERPQAWNYGPVIPKVYHEFKEFGRSPIKGRAVTIEWPKSGNLEDFLNAYFIQPKIEEDDDAEKLLSRIWDLYSPMTGIQLSNMTHAENGAWYKAYHELGQGRRDVEIPDDLIKAEFAEKARRGADERQSA